MNTCKTCIFWGVENYLLGPTRNACANPKLNGFDTPDDGAGAITYVNPELIETGPDFGCIHHEKTPARKSLVMKLLATEKNHAKIAEQAQVSRQFVWQCAKATQPTQKLATQGS